MANYIYTILMSKLMVVLSWGFNSPNAITNGLRFKVQGVKFTGIVEVIYNAGMDLFEIYLSDGRVEADVYADCLVDVIDGLVERTDDYADRVKKEYGLVNR
ncbi:MAG: hypothetical protein J6Q60_06260 [Bacteroidaceae bacterium]|nr:hypothetical protein [Bacteroidaceae bacterium]